ncbi:MAG TPA: hypothetical protein VF773_04590 [Verrucomicrobiae bacterium]
MRSFLSFVALFFAFTGVEAAERTLAGALAKNGKWEVSVDFPADFARDSLVQIGNYSLPGAMNAEIEAIRYVSLDNAVVLTVSGLVTNDLYSVRVENLFDTKGELLPAQIESFSARAMSWVTVGAQELGFRAETVSVGRSGFDLISGGSEMRGIYDESTFVFERIEGDFNKVVRVDMQEASSEEARAGLMVREVLDERKRRPSDPTSLEEAFSRYLQVFVTPAATAEGNPGDNRHEINIRYFSGGIGGTNGEVTVNLPLTNHPAPPYTNAWLRLRRGGDEFEVYRGDDGMNWISLGKVSFPTNDASGSPVAAFPKIAYVGPNYAPEIALLSESGGKRRSFLAKFREYGNGFEMPRPILRINRVGNGALLEWSGGGTLQSSTNLAIETWRDLPGGSPFALPKIKEKPQEYFRVRVP